MKKIATLFALALIAASSLHCGPWWSRPARTGKKIRFANEESLVSTLQENKEINVQALQYMGILAAFADKEFYDEDVEGKLDTFVQNAWEVVSKQVEQQLGKECFEQEKDKQYEGFMDGFKYIKPILLGVLRESATVISE